MNPPLPLPFAFGEPALAALIRVEPADFEVDEELGYEPGGEGSHAWLRIEKSGANTDWVAKRLAKLAGCSNLEVGFAGLKDRHAVTTQWFSVNLLGQSMPNWVLLEGSEIRVLEVTRHPKKLRRGGLLANRFRIRLRGIGDDIEGDFDIRAKRITEMGVPNYFGLQRFGWQGKNLEGALAMFQRREHPRGRHLRGLYISAARAELFNMVLAARIRAGTWASVTPGEAVISQTGARAFVHYRAREVANGGLERAIEEQTLHPAGPLWGQGEGLARGYARAFELAVLKDATAWRQGLESVGLAQERRALRLRVQGLLTWRDGPDRRVEFTLRRGCYATSVLRELVNTGAGPGSQRAGP